MSPEDFMMTKREWLQIHIHQKNGFLTLKGKSQQRTLPFLTSPHTHTHNHDTYYTPSQKSPNLHHYTYMDLASVIKPSFWSRFDANTAPKMRSSWAPKMLYRPSPLPKIPFILQKHGQLWSWQGHALVHINNWIAPCPPCSCSCLLVYVHGVW